MYVCPIPRLDTEAVLFLFFLQAHQMNITRQSGYMEESKNILQNRMERFMNRTDQIGLNYVCRMDL